MLRDLKSFFMEYSGVSFLRDIILNSFFPGSIPQILEDLCSLISISSLNSRFVTPSNVIAFPVESLLIIFRHSSKDNLGRKGKSWQTSHVSCPGFVLLKLNISNKVLNGSMHYDIDARAEHNLKIADSRWKKRISKLFNSNLFP